MKNSKKKSVQIYLEARQDQALSYLAKKNKTSKSKLIRLSINDYLRKKIKPNDDPALDIIGLGGLSRHINLAEKHDNYVSETEDND